MNDDSASRYSRIKAEKERYLLSMFFATLSQPIVNAAYLQDLLAIAVLESLIQSMETLLSEMEEDRAWTGADQIIDGVPS